MKDTVVQTQQPNPILVTVTRGGIVESFHRGMFAVVNTEGAVEMSAGNICQDIYPRSSVKIFQAFPAILRGAVDAFSLTVEEVAVLCASHNGEPRHVQTVENILKKAGFTAKDLECGIHRPTDKKSADALVRSSQAFTVLHNNCSGKHAGMLMLAKLLGVTHKGYINATHPVQKIIRETLENFTGGTLQNAPVDKDGCSVPTWAIPLKNIAIAFSKVAKPDDTLAEEASKAIKTLRDSVLRAPFMVAGTDRCCTRVMEVLQNKAFVKYGAEAVYGVSVPERGLGICIKIDDGSTRAVECAMLRILEKIGILPGEAKTQLANFYKKPIKNCLGFTVGHVEPVF